MIVIQKCHIQGLDPESPPGSSEALATEQPEQWENPWAGMVGLSGMDLSRRPVEWVVSREGVRSLSFPNQVVMVPREEVEKLIVSSIQDDVFTLWARGRFRFPTRIPVPGRPDGSGSTESATSTAEPPKLTRQNMELGSVFGTISQLKLVGTLRRLGYVVDETTWSELMR
jgi:hypothetical protein